MMPRMHTFCFLCRRPVQTGQRWQRAFIVVTVVVVITMVVVIVVAALFIIVEQRWRLQTIVVCQHNGLQRAEVHMRHHGRTGGCIVQSTTWIGHG